jgi:mersacidin/lichenicidin family type 2 lantibiotic
MSNVSIIRAWKDAEYRESLSAEELAMVPENPAGAVELKDEELARMFGGDNPNYQNFSAPSSNGSVAIASCSSNLGNLAILFAETTSTSCINTNKPLNLQQN